MKKNTSFQLLSIACFVLLVMSCSDDTEVGYGLLEGEALEVQFKDDIELIAKTIDRGPIVTYALGSPTLASLAIGALDDPIFGKFNSEVYFSPSIFSNSAGEFIGGTFDSLILTIRIDSSFSYGSQTAPHNLKVELIANQIIADSLFSDRQFEVEADPIGSKDGIIPSRIDSVTVPDGVSDTTFTKIKDIIRIPLNRIGRTLFRDTAIHATTETLREAFAGIKISDATENSVFFIRNTSYITLYYHDPDGNFEEYIYFLNGGPLTPNFTNNYAGTPIETIIDVPVGATDNLYLQGLAGTDVSIDVSGIREIGGSLINHASLEFYIAEEIGRDTVLFPYAENLILQKQGETGLESIEDIAIASSFIQDLRHFGGFREKDLTTNKFKYEMNITTHLIDVLNGREGDLLYLRIGSKANNSATTILYGPNHPQFPAKLKLTYTKS